ncbi:hypothetical protein BH10BDE1_BH10BDE1_25570 [soil metagenome]
MSQLRSMRGQALIELLVAAPVVALVIAGGVSLLYLGFAKAWITRAAREGAICLQTPITKSECRTRIERTLASGLPFGQIKIDEFQKTPNFTRVRIVLDFDRTSKISEAQLVEGAVSVRNIQ